MFCHQKGLFYPHTTTGWNYSTNTRAQVCFRVCNQHTDVLLLVWLGKLSHRAKLIPLKHLSPGLPAALVSNSNQTCMFTSGPIRVRLSRQQTDQRRTRWSVVVLLLHMTVYLYLYTRSLPYFCLYFVIYPWVSDCITPRKRIKAATHTYTHTNTHSSTHTNSNPCHCITTHAQARVNPSPFIMHHEHTRLQAQKRRSRSVWHCFFLR